MRSAGRRPGGPLGPGFARLWTSNAVANLGDGVTLAAGPLLVASLTRDPFLVGFAVFVQRLPWLLFGLLAGALVDRLDRLRIVVVGDAVRAVLIGGLAVSVATGTVSLAVVYAVLFVLGTFESVADNARSALLPALVGPDVLPSANARLTGARLVTNELVGPPVGASLFVLAAALPFGVDAVCFAVSALVLLGLRRHLPAAPARERRPPVLDEIAEGARWLWAHHGLRFLALLLCLMNLTLAGALSILVLVSQERYGMGEAGYGVLLSATAVGGLLGTAVVARAERRFGTATLLRVGICVEASTHLVLALTRSPVLAVAVLVLFGAHASVWGVLTMSLRQRVVPGGLLGRVNSVYFVFSVGGAALGSLAGGLVARAGGLTAPFWTAFALMVLVAVAGWRLLTPERLAAG